MINSAQRASDVRTKETINLGAVITGASSSVAAVPIIAAQGSLEPKFFTNSTDFVFEYGTPNPAVSGTVQSGVNFLTEGTGLWSIRVAGEGYRYAGLLLATDNSGVLSVVPTPVSDLAVDMATLAPAGKQALALFYPARGPGSHGNTLQVEIVANSGTTTPIATVTAVEDTALLGTLPHTTDFEYYVAPLMSDGERSATKATFTSGATFTGGVKLSWAAVPNAIGYYVYGRTAAGIGRIALLGMGSGAIITYTDVGSIIPNSTLKPVTQLGTTFQDRPFVVRVFDGSSASPNPVEEFTCTLRPGVDSNGAPLELEDRINPFSRYLRVINNAHALVAWPNVTSQPKTALTGGDSGAAPLSSQVIKAFSVFGSRQNYTVNLLINAGLADPALQVAMDTMARNRGDCVALLDVPSAWQEWNRAIDYRNLVLKLKSDSSGLFAQDQLQMINGTTAYAPLSGWVAALCARTDRVATPAHSPAGLNRGRLPVLGSRYQYDDEQASALYRAQVNYTRTFTTEGVALWEQQTLGGDIPWLSVRRIVNVIKTSVYTYLLYALQEMGVDATRREVVNGVSAYLDRVAAAEAISSGSIVCDNSNNPTSLSNAGVLVFRVVLVPAIPIHEIQLEVVVSEAGVSFSETVKTNSTSNTTNEFSSTRPF